MASKSDKYADYVVHPRFGRGPRYTVLNPDPVDADRPLLTSGGRRIPQTEVVTATRCYSDIERLCLECRRPFIFFAEEQIYWYETLGFSVGAVYLRCVECRKQRQQLAKLRERYQTLSSRSQKTVQESLEIAECCLSLIEHAEFTHNQLSHVRAMLKSLRADLPVEIREQSHRLFERVLKLEA